MISHYHSDLRIYTIPEFGFASWSVWENDKSLAKHVNKDSLLGRTYLQQWKNSEWKQVNINVIRYTYQDVTTYFSSWRLFDCLRICRYVLSNNIIKIFPEGKAQDRLLRAESRVLLEQVHLHYRHDIVMYLGEIIIVSEGIIFIISWQPI